MRLFREPHFFGWDVGLTVWWRALLASAHVAMLVRLRNDHNHDEQSLSIWHPRQIVTFRAILSDCARRNLQANGRRCVASVAMILMGQPFVRTRGKFANAVKGTSVASMVSRSLLPVEIKYRILPTITSFSSVFALRIKFTRNLGAFVGRQFPESAGFRSLLTYRASCGARVSSTTRPSSRRTAGDGHRRTSLGRAPDLR